MYSAGTRYQIPHLWAYFVLDQILPISFTQNLFCAALFLTQNLPQAASLKGAAPGDQFALTFFYVLGLSIAPTQVDTTAFYAILFGIRGLLFAPYWVLKPGVRSKTNVAGGSIAGLYWEYRFSALVLVVGGMFLHLRQTRAALPIVEAIKAVNDNPAVAALGYDYVIGAVSLMVFVVTRRV